LPSLYHILMSHTSGNASKEPTVGELPISYQLACNQLHQHKQASQSRALNLHSFFGDPPHHQTLSNPAPLPGPTAGFFSTCTTQQNADLLPSGTMAQLLSNDEAVNSTRSSAPKFYLSLDEGFYLQTPSMFKVLNLTYLFVSALEC